jgi:hypothetical protein
MHDFIQILFFISLAGTVASLVFGLTIYFMGGDIYKKYGNAAMRWRVLFQALTLILFFLMM